METGANRRPHETLSSNTLFHFTSSYENLINILTYEFIPQLSCEIIDTSYFSKNSKEITYSPIPMICFCDLPLSKVKNHVETYGNYAIGMKKSWGIMQGVQPVIYYEKNSTLFKNLLDSAEKNIQVARLLKNEFKSNSNPSETLKAALEASSSSSLVAFSVHMISKPYEGVMLRGDKLTNTIRFYDEREWRFIPKFEKLDSIIDFYKPINNVDEYRKMKSEMNFTNYKISFSPKDISYLIIKNEEEILKIYDDIKNIKGSKYSHNDVTLLQSRILTIDQVLNDF